MEHKRYIARQRARFEGVSGRVNIPCGTVLEADNGFLMWKGEQLCGVTSQNAYDYFSQDDDGQGRRRGELVTAILARLRPRNERDTSHLARWDKVWEDALCRKYRRPEHEDHWLWNYEFYNAPVMDLLQIAALVGAVVKRQ